MTAEQFDIIRAIIKSAYPSFNIMPDKYSIKLWYTMLGDLDYSLCETALQELIATHTYPPQISEIRAKCAEYTAPQLKRRRGGLGRCPEGDSEIWVLQI